MAVLLEMLWQHPPCIYPQLKIVPGYNTDNLPLDELHKSCSSQAVLENDWVVLDKLKLLRHVFKSLVGMQSTARLVMLSSTESDTEYFTIQNLLLNTHNL